MGGPYTIVHEDIRKVRDTGGMLPEENRGTIWDSEVRLKVSSSTLIRIKSCKKGKQTHE